MQNSLRHPAHSGSFVRSKGGWGSYHRWCLDNGYMRMNKDAQGNLFPMFIFKPRETGKKIGRNDPCVCGSGKKYKKCCR